MNICVATGIATTSLSQHCHLIFSYLLRGGSVWRSDQYVPESPVSFTPIGTAIYSSSPFLAVYEWNFKINYFRRWLRKLKLGYAIPISTKMNNFRLPLQPKLEKLQIWTFFLVYHPFQHLWYFPCLFAVVRPPLLRFYIYITKNKISRYIHAYKRT